MSAFRAPPGGGCAAYFTIPHLDRLCNRTDRSTPFDTVRRNPAKAVLQSTAWAHRAVIEGEADGVGGVGGAHGASLWW